MIDKVPTFARRAESAALQEGDRQALLAEVSAAHLTTQLDSASGVAAHVQPCSSSAQGAAGASMLQGPAGQSDWCFLMGEPGPAEDLALEMAAQQAALQSAAQERHAHAAQRSTKSAACSTRGRAWWRDRLQRLVASLWARAADLIAHAATRLKLAARYDSCLPVCCCSCPSASIPVRSLGF
jgi:hypothetical protein